MIKLVLSSNTTDFTTYLTSPITLKKDTKYEAAFLSLHTYNSLPNITEDNNKFKYSNDNGNSWTIINFPKGAYEFNEINSWIQKEMQTNGDYDEYNSNYYIDMDYYKPTFQTILDISNDQYMVDFNVENSIASRLGFTTEKLPTGIHKSPNIINIEKVNSILVHCNIITGTYVNTTKSQVIYNFTPRVSPGHKIIQTASPELIYLPVIESPDIQSIRIWLTDQYNKPIDLMGEEITIDILIREKIN